MLTKKASASLAAGLSAYPLANQAIESAPQGGYLEVGVNGGSGLLFSVTVGGYTVTLNDPVVVGTAYPTLPDQLAFQDMIVPPGARISLEVFNPTAGALTYYAYVRLSEVPRGR